jgi:hypothetical protein
MGMKVDCSRWPLVVYTYDGPFASQDEIDACLKAQEAVLQRGAKFAVVVNMQGEAPPADQRALQARWEKHNHELLKQRVVGVGFAAPSLLMRGAITAMSWIHPWPHPCEVFASYREAEAYARGKLAEASLSI